MLILINNLIIALKSISIKIYGKNEECLNFYCEYCHGNN